jgi:hypothetical protein
MFVRDYGLVHNPGDSERYVRLVRWEGRWSKPDAEGFETFTVTPLAREWTMLDVSNPRSPDYEGPVRKLVQTSVTELRFSAMTRAQWPKDAPAESEAMRRERIRAIRRAIHVDAVLGEREPVWGLPGDRAIQKAVDFGRNYGRTTEGLGAVA